MNTISEPTAANACRAASGGADGGVSCFSRQHRARHAPPATGDCRGKSPSRSSGSLRSRSSTTDAVAQSPGANILEMGMEQGAQTSDADTSTLLAVEDLPCSQRLCQPVSGQDPAEKLMYGALAGGMVMAVSYGLYWVVELVVHWSVFNSGIEKLVR